MKKKAIIAVVVFVGFYGALYFWNREEQSIENHPTIHSAAAKPDDYLLEAKSFEKKQRHDKSAQSIEQAIQAIWKLEKDVDDESFDRLEQAISRLEVAHRKILRDSISPKELRSVFEYALGNLAHAELEVAEKYSRSNQSSEAHAALVYAQLHIKNALILHNPNDMDDTTEVAYEEELLSRIDDLLNQEDMDQETYTASLDQLRKDLDQFISQIEAE
ncbi:MAG: hypothetical protein RIC35_11235 [Marinoscillum sp.]